MTNFHYAYTRGMKQIGLALLDEPYACHLLSNVYNTFRFASSELLALQVGHNEEPFINNLDQDRGDYVRLM